MTYNPFNPRNRAFTAKDVQAILDAHDVPFQVLNSDMYQTAMVHSSYVKRTEYTLPSGERTELAPRPSGCIGLFDTSYERLEHLGDSILGTCVSTYLMTRFPTENEGFLTDIKKEIVCNDMLGQLSLKIGLADFYIISRHNETTCGGRANPKKLGDILEAFIGALWTDSGNNYPVVSAFVVALVEKHIDIPRLLMNNRNFKEQLQKIYHARFHALPTYVLLAAPLGTFRVAVADPRGTYIGQGSGPTKKQAEQAAAEQAIRSLGSS